MAGAYGKAGKHLALARRCVLDGRLTHPPDGKRRGAGGRRRMAGLRPAIPRAGASGSRPCARCARPPPPPLGWDEQLPPGKGRRGRAGDMGPCSSARPLGPWRRAPRGGGSPRPSGGGAAVSARLRRAETKAPAAMAAGAKKGFALPPPPPGGRPGEAGRPAVTSSSARRGCPSGGGNGAACRRIGSRLPQWRGRWGWR